MRFFFNVKSMTSVYKELHFPEYIYDNHPRTSSTYLYENYKDDYSPQKKIQLHISTLAP